MESEFLLGVFPVELYQPTKFQRSVVQIGKDSSIYILQIILG